MKNKAHTWRTLAFLVIGLAIVIALVNIFMANLDKIPIEIQSLGFFTLVIVSSEGVGFRYIANYCEIDAKIGALAFIPVVRNYTIGKIVENTDYEKLGKFQLSLYTGVLSIVLFLVGYFAIPTSNPKLRANLTFIALIIMIISIIIKTVYVFLILNVLYTEETESLSSKIVPLTSLLIVSQPIVLYFTVKRVKRLKRENASAELNG